MKKALFLTALLAGLALCLGGCTMYDVKKADGTEFHIRSTRSFPNGLTIDYASPQGATLKIVAGSVSQPDPLSAIGAQAVNALLGKALGAAPAAPGAATPVQGSPASVAPGAAQAAPQPAAVAAGGK